MRLVEEYIIDRFEEQFAVLEKKDGGTVDIPKNYIPDANEGDVVILENGVYRVDKTKTLERKEIIAKKMRKLFEKK